MVHPNHLPLGDFPQLPAQTRGGRRAGSPAQRSYNSSHIRLEFHLKNSKASPLAVISSLVRMSPGVQVEAIYHGPATDLPEVIKVSFLDVSLSAQHI